jgi:dihydroflavonol-4-reductase
MHEESIMKAFVTGGTGFLGSHLVRKLLDRGDQVNMIVRSGKDAEIWEAAGAKAYLGDTLLKESMRNAMQGCDVVFHAAGWYKLGAAGAEKAEDINVRGTRNVLGLAYELGIPKIIYASSLVVFGDTHGQLVDENYVMPPAPFLTEYDRTKWEAHYSVALPLIHKGAPVTIVMPGAIYGPGDHSLVGEMMKRFYFGQLPVVPGPEATVTYAHVDDIAEGHILAAEKGEPGETYIIAGPVVPFGQMVKIWADITGKPAPSIEIPAAYFKPFAPLVGLVESIVPLPEIYSQEAIAIMDASYTGRADKAKQELGWQPRPLREGMRETFDWIAQNVPAPQPDVAKRRQIAALSLGAGLGLLLVWLLTRRRK